VLRFTTTEQSIHEGSQVQQIPRSGYEIITGPRLYAGLVGHSIRPLDRNKAPTSVGTKNEEKQGSVLPANLLQNLKRPARENMRLARDLHRARKLAEVGSLS